MPVVGAAGSTPGRYTLLRVDPQGPPIALKRPGWYENRAADNIGLARVINGHTRRHVMSHPVTSAAHPNLGRLAYTLRPANLDGIWDAHEDYSEHQISLAEWNIAPYHEEVASWSPDANKTGVPAPTGYIGRKPMIQRRIPAGGDWNDELAADATGYPGPDASNVLYGMLRVAVSKSTFPALTPFRFEAINPREFLSPTVMANYYFGGRTDALAAYTSPPDTEGQWVDRAGEYCLSVYSNGHAVLYELVGISGGEGDWRPRKAVTWSGAGRGDSTWTGGFEFAVIPFGFDGLDILSGYVYVFDTDQSLAEQLAEFMPTEIRQRNYQNTGLHIEGPKTTGRRKRYAMTGVGPVRVDTPLNSRPRWNVSRLVYPNSQSGILVDAPFRVPRAVESGDVIILEVDAYVPNLCQIVPTVRRLSNGAALAGSVLGDTLYFTAIAGVNDYYVTFELSSDPNGYQTPVLYGYRVGVSQVLYANATSMTAITEIKGVDVDAGGQSPESQAARVSLVQEVNSNASLLATRGHYYAQVTEHDVSDGSLISILHEGYVHEPTTQWIGNLSTSHSDFYRAQVYLNNKEVPVLGMWEKLRRRIVDFNDPTRYIYDTTSPRDHRGALQRWKITSIIKDALMVAGFSTAQVSGIPDINIRLGPDVTEFGLMAGMSVMPFAYELAQRRLNSGLVWYANSGGNYGTWKLLPNPQSLGDNVLCTFYQGPDPGYVSTEAAAYVSGTYILKGTLTKTLVPPECSSVRVTGGPLKDGVRLSQIYRNPLAVGTFSDPTSPSYLGEHSQMEIVDPSITDIPTLNYVTRAIAQRATLPHTVYRFHAPLFLVTDLTDAGQVRPRPLAWGDQVSLDGIGLGFVRACRPAIHISERYQMMDIEVEVPEV